MLIYLSYLVIIQFFPWKQCRTLIRFKDCPCSADFQSTLEQIIQIRRYYFNVMHKLVALWCFVAVPPLHVFLRPVSCYQHQASRKRANERRSSDAHEARFQKPPVNAHFSTKPKPWSTWSPLLPHPPCYYLNRDISEWRVYSLPLLSRFPDHLWSISANKRDQIPKIVRLINLQIHDDPLI